MIEYPSVEHIMKVTGFITPTRAKGAIETLKWLENGAPETAFDGLKGRFKFNMDKFVTDIYDEDNNKKHCGTAACIAGSVYAYTKRMNGDDKKTDYIALDMIFHLNDDDRTLSKTKKKLLHDLFYPYILNKNWENIKPKHAATVLRNYLETGEVDWKMGEDL